jgi:ribosomal protein S18 acetylase RimI-like enzyme
MMEVATATYRDVARWLDLAAEVEPLFGSMLDDPEIYRVLLRGIERQTAFCVREEDGVPGTPLLGGLLYSPARPDRPEHRIIWLAVTAQSRRLGVGRRLVERACGLVAPPATLAVVTFGADNLPGRPARRLYERLGFLPQEAASRGPEGGSRQVYRRIFPLSPQD